MKKPEIKKPEVRKEEYKTPDFVKSQFQIPPMIQKELDEQDLVGRWCNIKQLELGGGYHPKGWIPYIRKNPTEVEKLFGKSPDGFTRHGDLVLGVKKKEDVDAHRAYLRKEAKQNSVKELSKRTKKKFQDSIRNANAEDAIRVVEGYDED